MNQLGAIYITHPERITVGALAYSEKQDNALVVLDLANLLPVCRDTDMAELCAYCLPRIEVVKPYLVGDLQVCLKTKRIKVGWVCTSDSPEGSVIYSIRLYRDVIMKRWGSVFVHYHSTNVKEEEDGKTT